MSAVYYIRCEGTGLIKIGLSSDVRARLSQLQVSSTSNLVLLATEQGGGATEKARHRQFEAARVRGEWFNPVSDLMAHIETLEPYETRQRRTLTLTGTQLSDVQVAAALGCSRAYPTQMRLGMRPITLEVAVTLYSRTGEKAGPILGATDAELETLVKYVLAAPHFEGADPAHNPHVKGSDHGRLACC